MDNYPSGVRSLCLLLCLALMGLASCSPQEGSRRVTGVVVEIESSGLARVEQFTLQDEGRRVTILVDDETEFAFAPSHLNEHRARGEPVAVEVEKREGGLYAVSVDDT
jgi:hypothetical protein